MCALFIRSKDLESFAEKGGLRFDKSSTSHSLQVGRPEEFTSCWTILLLLTRRDEKADMMTRAPGVSANYKGRELYLWSS